MKSAISKPAILLLLICCPATFAQRSSSLASILADFKSSSPVQRSEAFNKVKGDRQALKQREVQEALFELMDYENHDNGSGTGHGEGHSAYLSDLLDTVLTFTDWSSSREVCILADSDYGVPSTFARELAIKAGQLAAPCLLDRAALHDEGQYASAIEELLLISSVNTDLSGNMREKIQMLAMGALRDSRAAVRYRTAEAIGRFGMADWLPVLRKLAQSDPYVFPGSKPADYFVRDVAEKAIQAIQQRAKEQ